MDKIADDKNGGLHKPMKRRGFDMGFGGDGCQGFDPRPRPKLER